MIVLSAKLSCHHQPKEMFVDIYIFSTHCWVAISQTYILCVITIFWSNRHFSCNWKLNLKRSHIRTIFAMFNVHPVFFFFLPFWTELQVRVSIWVCLPFFRLILKISRSIFRRLRIIGSHTEIQKFSDLEDADSLDLETVGFGPLSRGCWFWLGPWSRSRILDLEVAGSTSRGPSASLACCCLTETGKVIS